MADAYWRYSQTRQPPVPTLPGKRPRLEFNGPSGHDLTGYYGRDDARGTPLGLRDDSLGATYERYLRARPLNSLPIDNQRIMGLRGSDPGVAKGQSLGVGAERPENPVPPDASKTLFVEGLPANCSRREAAHIFRPFVGYQEVRLVTKNSRHSKGDALVLCFVDFLSPAHAAAAMNALQGYRFDEEDRDCINLRLQFARHPGARSGGGNRGRR